MKMLGNALIALCCFLGSVLSAQTSPSPITGYTGSVSIVPNANLSQVLIEFNSPTGVSPTSSQIVFVLAGDLASYPKPWNGKARVLVADGLVMILPADTATYPNTAYRFDTNPLPERLVSFAPQQFSVYQIARYGEKVPLTAAQVNELSVTGRYTPTHVTDYAAQAKAPDIRGVRSQAVASPQFACQSGGSGSTSCSQGGTGCSVSCKNGTYACCNDYNCTCPKGN